MGNDYLLLPTDKNQEAFNELTGHEQLYIMDRTRFKPNKSLHTIGQFATVRMLWRLNVYMD